MRGMRDSRESATSLVRKGYAMSAIELIALITAIITPIKLVIVLKSQRFWFRKVTKKFWRGSGNKTMLLSYLVAGICLAFLLQEMTIVQIWATALFVMALITAALAPFSKYMLEVEHKWFSETSVVRKGWLAGVVWAAISIWVLYALFV